MYMISLFIDWSTINVETFSIENCDKLVIRSIWLKPLCFIVKYNFAVSECKKNLENCSTIGLNCVKRLPYAFIRFY